MSRGSSEERLIGVSSTFKFVALGNRKKAREAEREILKDMTKVVQPMSPGEEPES